MSALFGVEFLQKLFFERSKLWAFTLDKFVGEETYCELDVNELGEAYDSDNDESDSTNELESMEEDESDDEPLDSEFLRNITNTTRLSLMLNNKTIIPPDSILNEEENELMDMLNQTLPIINEHNRQLQEFGLDKILKTFDKDEIEEKVGGWLNRHNSLYGGNNTMLVLAKNKNYDKRQNNAKYAVDRSLSSESRSGKEMFNDSDDSLQSGETARYIRSSRASSIKKSATTTTMIKTYRMIKSARESLRKKYDCEMDDNSRRIDNDLQYRQTSYNMKLHETRKFKITPMASQIQRRKVFRKRNFYKDYSTTDSSSDTDYCYEDYHSSRCKNIKLLGHHAFSAKYDSYSTLKGTKCSIKKTKCQRSAMKMPSAQMNRMHYFPNSQLKAFRCANRKRSAIKGKSKQYNDGLPSKVELDCRCCDEKKLCSDFKHIANSSTEKWYVENCGSIKQFPKKSTANAESIQSTICIPKETETAQKCFKPKKQKEKSIASSITESAKKAPPAKSKAGTSKSKNNLKVESAEETENSDLELKIAIEASKESYEREQKLKMMEKEQAKQKKILKSSLLSTLKTGEEVLNDIANDTNESNKKFSVKIESGGVEGKSVKQNCISNNTTDETFFTSTKVICNSTALSSKSQAYKRQISSECIDQEGKMEKLQNKPGTDLKKSIAKKNKTNISANKKIKSKVTAKERKQIEKVTASNNVSSTTIRSLEINSKFAPTQLDIVELEEEISISSDSDCMHVTSTTNVEQTPKGILVYAPENRGMLPENGTTSNGFFTITEEYLSTVIGEKQAEKLLKSYVGRKRFRLDSTVYYKPKERRAGKDSSSDSDALDYARQYGGFYEETK